MFSYGNHNLGLLMLFFSETSMAAVKLIPKNRMLIADSKELPFSSPLDTIDYYLITSALNINHHSCW